MDVQGWSLRDEFLALIQKWQLAAVIFILGSAAGWLSGTIWPVRYEARAALKVHFNSDAMYLTPDDYKNWQLEELEDLALSDPVLGETLSALAASDEYWQGWTPDRARGSAAPRWRNAGAWQLVMTLPDQERAEAFAAAWRTVLFEAAGDALDHAAAFNALDRRLDEIARQIGRADADLVQLEAFRSELEAWLAGDAPDPISGFSAAVFAQRLARSPELGVVLTVQFPGPDADPAALAAWVGSARTAIEDAAAARTDVRTGLLEAYSSLSADWLAEKSAAQGLSAYLSLEYPAQDAVQVERQYSRGIMAIAGGVAAVLFWLSTRLARTRGKAEEQDAG